MEGQQPHRSGPARAISAIALTLTLVATACGGTGTAPSAGTAAPAAAATATPKPAPEKVILLTDFLLWGWHSPIFAAKAQGFFTEQNLDVTIQAGKGSVDGGAQIGAGSVQFSLIDISTALLAQSKGADFKLIGVHLQQHPGSLLYIKERTTINTWKDIEGKKLGGARGDAYFTVLPGLMKGAGANPDKYSLVDIEGALTTGALISGQVDAIPGSAMTAPPRAAAAAKEGLTLARFSFADNGYKALGFSVAVNGKVLREKPDVVQRFVNAWAKATLWTLANRDKAVGDFLAANPDKQKELETQSFTASEPMIKGDGTYFAFDPAKLKLNVDFVNAQYGSTLKIDDVYTNEFVQKLPAGYTQGKLQ
jgi:NitT/TauT family transport system substrate-binding protein